MYLYQPCLLTIALFAWAFERSGRKRRWLGIWAPIAILTISEWEPGFSHIGLYPAVLLLPLIYLLGRARIVAWAEVLTAALLGGLLCWKAAYAWPLFPGSLPLCVALLLAPILPLCRSREDRLLACALGSLFFELFFCLREYMLFSYCVVRLGSREGLSLGTSAICLYVAFEQIAKAVRSHKKLASSVGN